MLPPNLKICSQCDIAKDRADFHAKKESGDGLAPACKLCRAEADRRRYAGRADLVRAYSKKRYYADPQRHVSRTKKWQRDNPSKFRAYKDASELKHKAVRAAKRQEWKRNNKARVQEQYATRQARKKQRTPAWADIGKIRAVYAEALRLSRETGIKYHVDHVVPLQGELVSGLHVEHNLRAIPAEENLRKNNRFEV